MGREDRSGLFQTNAELGLRFGDLYGEFWCNGQLDHELKEILRLRNARITDCGY
jgi:hypothetical protein